MSKEDLKRRVCEAIRARRADIKAVAESVFAEPELGFKETKTSDKIKAEFEKLGLTCETGWGITGVRARMKGKKSKKTVALLGELDAITGRRTAAVTTCSLPICSPSAWLLRTPASWTNLTAI